MKKRAFSLIELLAVVAILAVLSVLVLGSARDALHSAALAVSGNNLRQLTIGTVAYLGDHNLTFWRYRERIPREGVRWWYGFETEASLRAGEGHRWFDADGGPLGGYVPAGLRPDPSFAWTGRPFKPKYHFGYLGIGYNVLLADAEANRMRGWSGMGAPVGLLTLARPEETVVFATSAQVNTFQQPASLTNPMIEEFYGIDDRETTVHFRHKGKAMVAFANGAAGLLEMDPATLDQRAPEAMIGRFAPVGSRRHLR